MGELSMERWCEVKGPLYASERASNRAERSCCLSALVSRMSGCDKRGLALYSPGLPVLKVIEWRIHISFYRSKPARHTTERSKAVVNMADGRTNKKVRVLN